MISRSLIFERKIYFLSELGWVMHVVNINWGKWSLVKELV